MPHAHSTQPYIGASGGRATGPQGLGWSFSNLTKPTHDQRAPIGMGFGGSEPLSVSKLLGVNQKKNPLLADLLGNPFALQRLMQVGVDKSGVFELPILKEFAPLHNIMSDFNPANLFNFIR